MEKTWVRGSLTETGSGEIESTSVPSKFPENPSLRKMLTWTWSKQQQRSQGKKKQTTRIVIESSSRRRCRASFILANKHWTIGLGGWITDVNSSVIANCPGKGAEGCRHFFFFFLTFFFFWRPGQERSTDARRYRQSRLILFVSSPRGLSLLKKKKYCLTFSQVWEGESWGEGGAGENAFFFWKLYNHKPSHRTRYRSAFSIHLYIFIDMHVQESLDASTFL